MLKHMTAGTHPRVTRGDSVPPTPPLTAKVVGIPTMEVNFCSINKSLKQKRFSLHSVFLLIHVKRCFYCTYHFLHYFQELSNSPILNKRNDMSFTPSRMPHKGTPNGKISKEKNVQPNGDTSNISNLQSKREDRPVSVHGNLINNHSIYANTLMVPKMNGISSAGKGHPFPTESGSLTKTSNNVHTPNSKLTQSSLGTNLDTSYNALLNTSKLSSSNSPSTNGTNTTGMDSSRENPNVDFELSNRISPPTTATGMNVSLSRSSSHRQPQHQPEIQNRNYPS